MMSNSNDIDRQRLDNLRHYRNRKDRDLGLGFLKKQFKRDIERPLKQLGNLGQTWQELVPPNLAMHTRLEGFSSGVLRVTVDSSAHLYALDRLLRTGLQQQLSSENSASRLRRVQLKVGPT